MIRRDAIRVVWERMVATDGWMFSESEDPKDHARLEADCEHVAAVCRAKASGGRVTT